MPERPDPAAALHDRLDLDPAAARLVDALTRAEAAALDADVVQALDRHHDQLRAAVEGTMAFVPRLLRGPVRRVLGIR